MKRVYALAPGENWIVDRFVKEWNEDNRDIAAPSPEEADAIWLVAGWCWRQVRPSLLASKKVLTTVHHVVPEKFDARAAADFRALNEHTDAYHVPNEHTGAFVRARTKKPVHVVPYWANQRIWRPTGTREELRKKHGVPDGAFVIGSFQRDTEGAGISSGKHLPKLEKGPDLLADFITAQTHLPTHVLLAGWRRQYLTERLKAARVPYAYHEMPSQADLNELYQCCDLYPITARYEGGPQALTECGLLGVPVVSRDVGMASQLLPASAINDNVALATPAVPNVEHLKLPHGYEPYRDLLEAL